MDKNIGSFADMIGRASHLVWKDPPELHNITEMAEDDVLPHLADLRPTKHSTIANHVVSDRAMDHFEQRERRLRGTDAVHSVRDYKKDSEEYNKPLRSGPRVGDKIAIGHHYEPHAMGEGGRDWGRHKSQQLIQSIHHVAAAADSDVPEHMHVWRGIKPSSDIHRIPPGGYFTDHGFTGTSVDWQQAHGFAGEHGYQRAKSWSGQSYVTTGAPDHMDGARIMARIHVPQFTKGHYLDTGGERYGNEEELLLHRGTQYQVDRHELTPHPRGKGLVHVVHMTVVGQHGKPLVNHFGKPLKESTGLAHEILTAHGMKRMENVGGTGNGLTAGYDLDGHSATMFHDLQQAGWVQDPQNSTQRSVNSRVFRHPDGSKVHVQHFGAVKTQALTFEPFAESTGSIRPFRESADHAMKQVDEPYGTNEGGLHEDENGTEHYVKHYKDPDQGRTEALAGKIYNHLGVKTVGTEHSHVNGKPATISRFDRKLEPMHHSEYANLNPAQADQVGRMHAGALLMKDYDVVGTGFDNIMRHKETGNLHTVDHGAAFRFRARGEPKAYTPNVVHDELIDNDHDSGHVFDTVFNRHPTAHAAGKAAVARMDMGHVHNLFKNSGLHDWESLHDTFVARRSAFLAR